MKDLGKEKKSSLFASPVFIVLLGIFLVILILSSVRMFIKSQETRNTRNRYANELRALESQEVLLQEDIEYYSSPRGIEEELRDRFPVAKEGEEVIIIVDDETTDTEEQAQEDGFFKKWFR